ncbi:tetratricopeptide repeat protein [Micromonospora sp. NPDC049645]|uniref:tetratricopeptide repeat protein n=1 Tax=Micromonospora sp. NPDC049645 TaxID=3155508 RepID=UPI003441728C
MNIKDESAVSNTITGGVFFNHVVQGHTITVVLPPTVEPALSGLPPASVTFTGRDEQVRLLMQALAPHGESGPVLVSAVAGLAGIGKTELVVQTASRAAKETGWFPGGVLFVDMFGYDPQRRVAAEAALLRLLQALGLPGENIPATEADRSRLFRSLLAAFARQGRRILLVIDNVATADQVVPLLPSDGDTAVLITSRHTLDVGARLHDLDVLDRAASVHMLAEALHQARGPEDTRIHDQADAATRVADLCAGLPLALRIAAALLADHPTRPVASLAQALEAEHTRLDQLSREDRAVRAAFDLSYQNLSDPQATLFRLLPINPGPDLGTEAAAHLAGLDPQATEQILQDLARAHLIEAGHTWGRWRLHDLVRLYAGEHPDTAPDQRERAGVRLLEHYRTTTRDANTHIQPGPAPVSPRFGDRTVALAWLDDERPNLLAACASAAATGHPDISTDLASELSQFLNFRRFFDDWIEITGTAIQIFRETGDRHSEGSALNNLGVALLQVRRFDEAITIHLGAIAVVREVGDRNGEGIVLGNLGLALKEVRRFDEAISAQQQAATIFRETGDRHSEGRTLCHLGEALRETRRFDEAISAQQQAATIFRETGDRHGEGRTLGNLGLALMEVRRFDEAIIAHQQDLAICKVAKDRHGEGRALGNLGASLQGVGRFDEAISAQRQAVTIFREIGDRHGEGWALDTLGASLPGVGRLDEAITAHQQALEIFREIGDRHGEGRTLGNLGEALQGVGRFDEAISAQRQAATISREIGDRHGEGWALGNLGATLGRVGRFDEVRSNWKRAIEAFTDSGDRDTAALLTRWLDKLPPDTR